MSPVISCNQLPVDSSARLIRTYASAKMRCVCLCMGKGEHFFLDPLVSFLKAIPESDRRLPTQVLEDFGVVAVAPIDTLGGVQLVTKLQLHARDVFNNVDKLIDGDEFIRPKVQRLADIAFRDCPGPLGAVIDVHEAAGLMAVAPDLDLMLTR